MSVPVLHLILPCATCGAESGEPCLRKDGQVRKHSHGHRRPVAACGTYAGAVAHSKNGTPRCGPCREAARRYMSAYRDKHPDKRSQDIASLAARRRATRRLIEVHRAEFNQLMAEEATAPDG